MTSETLPPPGDTASVPLVRHEARSLAMLAGGNPAVLRVLQEVALRQRTSARLHARAAQSLSGLPSQLPYASPVLPLCIREAQGSRIIDVDGNEYIDCHMAYTAAILGHRPPEVLAVVQAALARGVGAGHFCEEQLELAELVKRLVPGVERVAFLHSGADAVSAAVRLARAHTTRVLGAKFEGCYHGWSEFGLYNPMLALAGRPSSDPPDQITPRAATGGVSVAAGTELIVVPHNSSAAIEAILARRDDLAFVLADPCPPFMSDHPEAAQAFVRRLRAATTEAGVPLVLDEVVSGFRLAPGGAQERYGVSADIVAYGKITSGLGIPLSIVAGKAWFLDAGRTAGLFADYGAGKAWTTTTHAGNQPAVAAALASLRLMESGFATFAEIMDRNDARLREGIANIARETGIPVAVSGHPRLQSYLVLGERRATEARYRAAISGMRPDDFRRHLTLALYLRLEGIYMKTVPTLNLSRAHSDDDVQRIVEAIGRSLRRMWADGALGDCAQ